MDSKEKETKCQKNSGVDYSLPISEYAKQLDLPVRDRYLQKIAAIGIDPVLVEGKDFKLDCLPPVESTDILCYLVLETSFYTQQQFKAFRSLEAYNQMVSLVNSETTVSQDQIPRQQFIQNSAVLS